MTVSEKDDLEAGCTAPAPARARGRASRKRWTWRGPIWIHEEELDEEQRRRLRTTVTVLLCLSAALGLFQAWALSSYRPMVLQIRSASEKAFYSGGFGVFFFLLAFSTFLGMTLRPCRRVEDMPRPTLACLVGLPVLLYAAEAVLFRLLGRDQVVITGWAAWAVDVAAAAAVGWCFWVDRRSTSPPASAIGADECGNARSRRTLVEIVHGRVARRKSAINFAMTVSAACAIVGGAAVACLPGAPTGAAFGLGFAGLLSLLSFSMIYVPMLRPPEYISKAFDRCSLTAVLLLVALYLTVLYLSISDKITAVLTGFLWAADVAVAVILGWFIFNTEDTSPCLITNEERLEAIRIF